MLNITQLKYMIGGKKILKGIDIELDNGVYGFLGPNGAGKTTLIRCLTGIYKLKKDCGDIVLDEKLHVTDREYINSSGYLPQSFGLFKDMKVRDALMYLAALKGMKEDEAKIDVEECLEKVNLSDRINDKVKTLSGGMVRRLGIAQALINDPRILILDEPTAGLDPKERVKFRNLLSSLARDRIVILSTHIVSDIEAIADRVFVMKRGQFVSQGSIRELLAEVQGHVWELAIDPAETEKWEEETTVANLRREDHQTILRVISEESPGAGAVQIQATLEDLYLYYFPTERS